MARNRYNQEFVLANPDAWRDMAPYNMQNAARELRNGDFIGAAFYYVCAAKRYGRSTEKRLESIAWHCANSIYRAIGLTGR